MSLRDKILLATQSIQTYPNATAEAKESPKAADFPRPRAAVRVTVLLKVFSDMASTNLRTAFAWKIFTTSKFNTFNQCSKLEKIRIN